MTRRGWVTDGMPSRRVMRDAFVGEAHEGHLEWLVTNGLGGYASGTVTGHLSRRFHGLLISSMPAPLGRVMMLPHVAERLRFSDGQVGWMGAPGDAAPLADAAAHSELVEFSLDGGIPTWTYAFPGATIERTLVMPHEHNSVHLRYSLVDATEGVRLDLRPLIGVRPHEAPVDSVPLEGYSLVATDRRIEVHNAVDLPVLRLVLHADHGVFTVDNQAVADVRYIIEQHRGYDHEGHLWSPGYFRSTLAPGQSITFIASTEPWTVIAGESPDAVLASELQRRTGLVRAVGPAQHDPRIAELTLAADQFIVRPAAREPVTDSTGRDRSDVGGERRTILAGYHWFTDWGRDTMIALEGLTLVTGRCHEARQILLEFARHVRNGLVPNFFPEGAHEGVYHTADASLWFFHAVQRYERYSGDTATVDALLPVLLSILDHHEQGTSFGIRMTDDGLLTQGAPGYQLTWMDAKAGDWVVTPRRGKAVEINALWYNALALTHAWMAERGEVERAAHLRARLDTAYASFNARFWNAARGHLFDIVDGEAGDDDACRPNQVLALSLEHPVLAPDHWSAVLDVVTTELLTPSGLRSLSPQHPDYKPRYFGDLLTRDAAYHQGTVWAWLIGPYVDAFLRVHPDDAAGARAAAAGLCEHLGHACLGSVSEIFDAEAPYAPRGCIAQAWSVAELVRVLVRVETADGA